MPEIVRVALGPGKEKEIREWREWGALILAAILTPVTTAVTILILAIAWVIERLQWARKNPQERREELKKLTGIPPAA